MLVIVVIAIAVVAVVTTFQRTRPGRWIIVATGSALVTVTVAVGITGYLLPWDQIAVPFTTGADLGGVFHAAFDANVKFLLFGNQEIGQATYRFWLYVHIGVGPGVLIILMVSLAWVVSRAEGRAVRSPGDAVEAGSGFS